ncbi:MAG: hypothetical protein K6E53_15910 [Lachnospiraceae bacterium]|nr:hypothetical protein [Lachnospiraceae bacterium]
MIDVTFDFTSDSPGYWDGYWERNDGLGYGGSDPDNASPTLHKYHQFLWSKSLPNGEKMDLKMGSGAYYLTCKDFRFGSDAIIVSFRYKKYKYMIDQVANRVGDYKGYYEDMLRKAYTIGGTIIFPKHPSSMNQNKGTNALISDRWDLTLECIRRYYIGERSPLYDTIIRDKAFYDLFLDFKGYVDFFFLQDAVSDDYSNVDIWCGNADFVEDGLPKNVDEYFAFIDKEFEFLNKRNRRIKEYGDMVLRGSEH